MIKEGENTKDRHCVRSDYVSLTLPINDSTDRESFPVLVEAQDTMYGVESVVRKKNREKDVVICQCLTVSAPDLFLRFFLRPKTP